MIPTPGDAPVVSVLPGGFQFPVEPHETVMAAAQRAGLYWPTICNGHARCGHCHVAVQSGHENVCAMGDQERSTLTKIRGAASPQQERLACQTKVKGPVIFRRRGVFDRSTSQEAN